MPLTSFQFWMAAGGCGPRAQHYIQDCRDHQFVRSQLWPFPFRSLVILQASATHSGALAQEALTIFFLSSVKSFRSVLVISYLSSFFYVQVAALSLE